jgi:transcriptional regulator
MYIPTHFQVTDENLLFDFIERYSFATLISTIDDAPFASHLPLLLDRENRILIGHLAKSNPHGKGLESSPQSLVIFTGPHGYISPTWYVKHPSVPTWNFTAVHIYGAVEVFSDADRLNDVVTRLTRVYESSRETPWTGDIPTEYRSNMLKSIVGLQIQITRLEGKFKLSQNRSPEEQQRVMENLEKSDHPDSKQLARLMRQHLGRE